MNTIYLVTEADYDGKTIYGAFSTDERARAYIIENKLNANVEEFDVDDYISPEPEFYTYKVSVHENGSIMRNYTADYTPDEPGHAYSMYRFYGVDACFNYLSVYVNAKDKLEAADRAMEVYHYCNKKYEWGVEWYSSDLGQLLNGVEPEFLVKKSGTSNND